MEYTFCPLCQTKLVLSEHGGKERPSCPKEGCSFVHWDNPIPVVAAIVEHEGDVLLVQNRGWPASWFGLVSGFLERNETPENGMLREIKEELDLDGNIVSLIGVFPFSVMNQVIISYHVLATGTVKLSEELVSIRRIPPEKLRPWPMGTGEAVQAWLQARSNKEKSDDDLE